MNLIELPIPETPPKIFQDEIAQEELRYLYQAIHILKQEIERLKNP